MQFTFFSQVIRPRQGRGHCAGKHGRADKEQEELERPGAGEELEYEDAEYGSSQSMDGHSLGLLCVLGGFSGTVLA